MNATRFLMQVLMSLFNFLFFANLDVTYRHPYGAFFTYLSLTFILLFYTWSRGGEWPLSPLGNSLLLRSELVPIHERRVYFP